MFGKPEPTLQAGAEVFPLILCVDLRSVGDLLAKWKRAYLVPGTKPGTKPGEDFYMSVVMDIFQCGRDWCWFLLSV